MDKKETMYRINQVVDMNGERKRYEQTVTAEVLERKDRYLRYTEQLDDYEIDVVMRVGDDFIKIQRRGIINMNFHFQQGETTDTFYESPAGKHHFRINTIVLDIGEVAIEIRYELYDHNGKLGDYHYKIRKVG
ncbi:DUF1934 domain-containing protein [Salinicoccus roseus]|uniref:DUF1934 family protein n=1 Tax=Salinicoccus roseus TaxID=45670 RepID=A0A0C2DK30_9STAP|nr:DUF1934 family protein [Salinicoccus roseus]KIH70338.1 hypothetical protein SN16_08695 [Salinicoccus roseus]MDB0580880.1 DUF1934 family protein [Salinicoccus roseus]